MWLTAISIRRPMLIIMAVLAIMIGGYLAYTTLAVDLLPSVKFPYVTVSTTYPGAGPREVESRVTKPIENAVAGSPGIKTLTSSSGDGYSLVLLEYMDGTDPDAAIQDVERRVNQIMSTLPDEVKAPTIQKVDLNDEAILVMGANWDRNPDELFHLVDNTIRPMIEAVPGVASVQVVGGRDREIQVVVDRTRLEGHGLSVTQITSALAAANLSMPSGDIHEGTNDYTVRVYGLYQDPSQLSGLVIGTTASGGIIRLGDVATVLDTFKKQNAISRVNGIEGVGILVQKQKTANTVAVADGVRKVVKDLGQTLPSGVTISTVMDNSEFVRQTLAAVQNNLRDSALIVAFVLLLFLHTWRSTLIVLVSIPTSLIATFAVIWTMGFTINMMTMMGMALCIGILVDDSIVILENIYRHLKMGKSPSTAAFNGRAEIGAAAVAITLVDVVVYTPMAFLTGMVGQFFKEFGGTVVIATLFSLLVSFTLTPMLASRWLKAADEERSPFAPLWRRWEAGYERLAAGYRQLLGRALRARWLVLLGGFLAFVVGMAMVALQVVPTEFLTQSDQGEFSVSLDMPPGYSLAATNDAVQQFEEQFTKLPEVESVLTLIGTGGSFGLPQKRSATVYAHLKSLAQRNRSSFQIADDARRIGSAIPGMQTTVAMPSMVGYTGPPISVRIRGADIDTLSAIATQAEEVIRRTPGTIDVKNSAEAGSPEIRLQIDQQKVSDLGLTTAQVASALRTAYEGTVATELRKENEDKVDIRVLYATDPNGSELASVPDISLSTPQGTMVKLSQVASLVPVEGPTVIDREARVRQITINANLGNRPLGEISEDIRTATKAIELPAGYSITMAGDTQLQEDAFGSLAKALGISILLMFMLMAALYDSLIYPLVIMGSLPVASVGAIGALAITHNTLSMFSLVGLIMLTGLVGKNAILLVDYTNTLRKRGYSRRDAILEAGPIRLRPILMTSTSMIFAMTPLALKLGEGAETRSPLAIVVIGGLITSTLLTLVVIPAGYTVMDDFQGWLAARLGRSSHEDQLPGEKSPSSADASQESASIGGWTESKTPPSPSVQTPPEDKHSRS
jgi:hydrophobic/amphiphilic exporter-1 (mainly G- bacteria), HAE1 family